MTQFKAYLLAGGMLAVMGTHAAMAVPTITYEVFDNGVMVVDPTSPGASTTSGNISPSGPAPGFSATGFNSTGVPQKVSPEFDSSGGVNSNSSSPYTFELRVTQTGLTSPTGTFNALSSLSLTQSNTSTAVSSIRSYIDPAGVAFAETILIGQLTDNGSGSVSNGTGFVTAVNVGANPNGFSETQDFIVSTSSPSDGASFLDDIVATATPPTAVPEPASIALIGTALFGFGLIRRRRNRG